MNKRRIGVLTVIILALVTIAYYSFQLFDNTSEHPLPFSKKPIKQATLQRSYSSLPDIPINSIALDSIHNARLFNLIDESNWYLFDYSKKKIAYFNIKSGLCHYIGEGEGKGPGEFVNPTDYTISNTGTIWVIDGPTSRVTKYDSKGKLLGLKKLERTPHRIEHLSDSSFALLTRNFSELSYWDWDSNSWNTSQPFINEKEKWSSLLDSRLTKTSSSQKIIQVPTYLDFIVTYDQKGNLDQIINQVFQNNSGMIKYRKSNNSYSLLRQRVTEFCIDVDANSENIYVLKMKNNQEHQKVIDIYDKVSGRYKSSVSLPPGIREIEVHQEYLFTMSADFVKQYRL